MSTRRTGSTRKLRREIADAEAARRISLTRDLHDGLAGQLVSMVALSDRTGADARNARRETPDGVTLAKAHRLVVDNLMMLGGGARMVEVARRIVTKVTLTPTPEGNGLETEMEGGFTRAEELLQALESKQPAS
ncbi:hypothetical protein [Azospirillum isscasi]|uniref:Signal transduction histidine kinase subgroup 3 dimerisation and phosphoacceptor domain-containing protein n=1 Tax=Azospirillum isscasi TaxID=3053926 RepID=A0ABU0WQJ1_9PROT|nr:hypothetical protein [Azospirillum isscasi]MDQ2106513.1 hypothetical protein [Azospirillum isscasi]